MVDSTTQQVRYVYVDVVGFTLDRSVEAQTEIVGALNELVLEGLRAVNVSRAQAILIPTGDGACIAIMDREAAFDIHLQLARDLVGRVHKRNEAEGDEMRQFSLRLGINENVDNVVEDINGSRNVAGAGISSARRIMDLADAQQILAGSTVYETLRQREKYMKAFRKFSARIKHGASLDVYQYILEGTPGLSLGIPSYFEVAPAKERELSEFEAYYFAHSLQSRSLFAANRGDPSIRYAAVTLLWFLAQDSVDAAHATEFSAPTRRTYGGFNTPIAEAYDHYRAISVWLTAAFLTLAREQFRGLEPYFEREGLGSLCHVVNDEGEAKLKRDHPGIWQAMLES